MSAEMKNTENTKKESLCKKQFLNGLFKENPTLVLMLGMCPTMAVTSQAIYGFGMGISTTVVLVLSNMMIAALRNIIPDKVRIPAFIGIIASFVTIVQLLLKAFVPALDVALGNYIPLIVVNCIILGRAESFASKNKIIPSMFDGLGMGLGFTVALTIIGLVREMIGSGTMFAYSYATIASNLAQLFGGSGEGAFISWLEGFVPITIMVLPPGAFFVLACLTAIQNRAKWKGEEKGKNMDKVQSGCHFDCASCGESGCEHRFYDENGFDGPVGKKEE